MSPWSIYSHCGYTTWLRYLKWLRTHYVIHSHTNCMLWFTEACEKLPSKSPQGTSCFSTESTGPQLPDPHKSITQSAGHLKIERPPPQTSGTGKKQHRFIFLVCYFEVQLHPSWPIALVTEIHSVLGWFIVEWTNCRETGDALQGSSRAAD